MRTQALAALAAVVALFALNPSSASEGACDGGLKAVSSETATDFMSAARSDRVPSQAPEVRGDATGTTPDPAMFKVAKLGTDRI